MALLGRKPELPAYGAQVVAKSANGSTLWPFTTCCSNSRTRRLRRTRSGSAGFPQTVIGTAEGVINDRIRARRQIDHRPGDAWDVFCMHSCVPKRWNWGVSAVVGRNPGEASSSQQRSSVIPNIVEREDAFCEYFVRGPRGRSN